MPKVNTLWARYMLPLLTIVVLLGLLAVALYRLSSIQRDMRHNTQANMVWVIYNAHLESLRLTDALQKQALQPNAAANPTFRYQILQSRLQLLNEGPQRRFMDRMGLLAELEQHSDALQGVADQVALSEQNGEQLAQLQQVFAAFNAFMLTASSRVMATQWEDMGAVIDNNRNAVLTVLFIMVAIVLCSVFISLQLLMALKRTRENERSKQRQLELEKQLEHERKVAELYRSFGAMLSHQFRTPLAIIDASMQRLMRASERLTPAEVVSRAAKAKTATERLTDLIERILDADRLLGKTAIERQRFCLATLIEHTLEEYCVPPNSRQLEFDGAEVGATWVLGDPVLAGQIISNLLSNADKYSPATQPVRIRLSQQEHWLGCHVQDHGRGIAAADLPNVFQRYFRAQAVADVVGTGIGLYVAQELAKLQGGYVSVTSVENQGSTFSLWLPRVTSHGGVA